jgi:PAS domain S-box-containing protein
LFNFNLLRLKFFEKNNQKYMNDAWFYSALTDCADGLWDWDLLTGNIHVSPKLHELLGYTEEEIRGLAHSWWINQIHPGDRLEIQKKVDELPESNSKFIYFDTCRVLCKNGDYVWLENHAKVLRDEKGKPTRMSGVSINITPQKFIQNQLRNIITELEKDARNKMRFLSALNHELRSPLSGIIGMVTLLKETSLTQEQQRFSENITNSTDMLLSLVNDILDVSKLSSGKFEFENIHFSPAQVIQRSIDLIRPSLIKKNLDFKLAINNGIPEFLIGDPTRLQQILVNLLTNAAKFTPKGSITLLAREEISDPSFSVLTNHNIRFEISDTGIGIDPQAQGHLFEDFTQADRSITRLYGGTGLGLSICKELVHLMGGQIGVKSELGKGSTFWFTIPFEHQENVLSGEIINDLPHAPPLTRQKLDILLVEDNQINQEVMYGLLKLLGDDITIASNGEEAIEIFKRQEFDLILMDLNMPVLDGLSATEAIRKLPHRQIPIIAVTANTFAADKENFLQHGITQVLNKPIDKVILEQTLLPYRSEMKPFEEPQKKDTLAPTTHSIVNKDALKTLIKDLGKEKVIWLLDIYRNDALDLVNQIKISSPKDSKSYAHTLAGMAENLGIQLIGRTARDIIGASEHAPENIPILVKDLEQQFEGSLVEIQDIIITSENIDSP